MDSLVKTGTTSFLDENKIITDKQHGFMKHRNVFSSPSWKLGGNEILSRHIRHYLEKRILPATNFLTVCQRI